MTSTLRLSSSFATIALAGATLAGCSGMGTPLATAPAVPAAIAVPVGNTLAFTLKGSGLLNYECRAKADTPGVQDWALVSPDAVLRDKNDAIVGKYYGGPTWEHGDGSKVVGKQLAVTPAPEAGNIPWQLVQTVSTSGPGMMVGVSYVQRIVTKGGVAPSDPCVATNVGTKQQVRYAADYLFYKA